EFETAKRDVQLAKTEIESLNAERARHKAAVEQLESNKIAAKNKAEVMKSVAYSTNVIAIMAIVSSLYFVLRQKSTGPNRIVRYPSAIQGTGHSSIADDPPPFKWSDLKYAFDIKKDSNGKEAIQASRDRREASAGRCSGLAGPEHGGSNPPDRGERGDVLSVAPGVWRAENRAGEAPEGP